MIKVKYKQYSGRDGMMFMGAIHKLLAASTDGLSAYRLRKALIPLKKAADQISSEWEKDIVEKFATKRDEAGKVVQSDPGFPVEGTDEKFDSAVKGFHEREVVVERARLTSKDIHGAQLSADEQDALSDVLDDTSFEQPENRSGIHAIK